MILANLFLIYAYEKRNVALYQAPSSLLKAILEAVPKYMKEKFRIVERLSEVESFDVLGIDEGYLTADAKDALRKNSSNFIKSITTLRHKSIFTIMNSLDNGILKGYRLKAQFRFYKLITDGYIEETRDKFAKNYGDIVTNLREEQTLFQITHIDFLKAGIRRGILELHLDDYCPWYNKKISRSFEGEDFDAGLREINKKKMRMEKVIQLITGKYGTKLLKTKTLQKVQGFLFDEHIKLYNEFEQYIPIIVKVAIYRMDELQEQQAEQDEQQKKSLIETIVIPNLSLENDNSCAVFFRDFYSSNGRNKMFQDLVFQVISKAMGLREAERFFNGSVKYNQIQKLITKFQSGKNLENPDYRFASVYEMYCAKKTGGIRAGGVGEPDIFYKNSDGDVIGIGECKFYMTHTGNSQEFFQQIKQKHNGKLNSGYNYCNKNDLEKYILFFRVVNWGNYDLAVPIPKEGSNKILIFKDEVPEHVEKFFNFNQEEFFQDNKLPKIEVKK